jgi:histidine ammonia-lyase
MSKVFNYGTDHLSIGICLDIAAGKIKGVIDTMAANRIKASWLEVEKIVHAHNPVYGINTGFGPLCDTRISEEDTSLLQSNLLKSHSVGVGKPIPQEIAKLMLITKVHALAQGYSGIAPATLERIIWLSTMILSRSYLKRVRLAHRATLHHCRTFSCR